MGKTSAIIGFGAGALFVYALVAPAYAHAPVASFVPQARAVIAPLATTSVFVSAHSIGTPRRLIISGARVDAEIVPVGVTPQGNLDVPPNYVDVGWYRFGPMPGMRGTAVLDGHVDDGSSRDGVFKHLRDLRMGDRIIIVDEYGGQTDFEVSATDVYQTDAFPSEEIFNDTSGILVKIITCHGVWMPSRTTYDQRLVITAKRVFPVQVVE